MIYPQWLGRGMCRVMVGMMTLIAVPLAPAASVPTEFVATEPVDLDLALTLAMAAYSAGPTEEALTVTVRRGISSWRESLVVRVDPGSGTKRPAACRLELDELAVYWSRGERTAGQIIAVHERDAEGVFTSSVEGDLTMQALAAALLPVPAPQVTLALDARALGDGRTMRWLTPYTPSVTWTEATKDARRTLGDIVITGLCEPITSPVAGELPIAPGKASMTIDEASGRLKRLVLEVDGGKMELDIRVRIEKPLERSKWEIATAQRKAVGALSLLGPKKGDAAGAKSLPDIVLHDANGRVWLPAEAFVVPKEERASKLLPEVLAMVFVRESEAGMGDALRFEHAGARLAKQVIEAENAARAASKPPDAPLAVKVVLVLDKPDDRSRTLVSRGVQEWGGDVVWTTSPAASIDRFVTDARSALVLVKRDMSVCGVIDLGAAKMTDEAVASLRDRISQLLRCPGTQPVPAEVPAKQP